MLAQDNSWPWLRPKQTSWPKDNLEAWNAMTDISDNGMSNTQQFAKTIPTFLALSSVIGTIWIPDHPNPSQAQVSSWHTLNQSPVRSTSENGGPGGFTRVLVGVGHHHVDTHCPHGAGGRIWKVGGNPHPNTLNTYWLMTCIISFFLDDWIPSVMEPWNSPTCRLECDIASNHAHKFMNDWSCFFPRGTTLDHGLLREMHATW